MNITITVDEVTLTSVIREVYGDDGREPRTVGDEVASQLVQRVVSDQDHWRPFRDQVTEIRDEMIREAVRPLIEQALTVPLPRTNQFGEHVGQVTTLSEIIVAEARKQLTAKADGSYRSDGQTIVQKMVADEVRKAFASVITEEVAKARDLVSAEIGQHVAAAVRNGLAKR